jgi:hypothetical protein
MQLWCPFQTKHLVGPWSRVNKSNNANKHGTSCVTVGARDLCRLQNFQIGCGTHPAVYSMRTSSFPGLKRPRREVNHLTSISCRVWSCTSVPPVCLHGMDTENRTFKPLLKGQDWPRLPPKNKDNSYSVGLERESRFPPQGLIWGRQRTCRRNVLFWFFNFLTLRQWKNSWSKWLQVWYAVVRILQNYSE